MGKKSTVGLLIIIIISTVVGAMILKPSDYCAIDSEGNLLRCAFKSIKSCQEHAGKGGWCKLEGTNTYITQLNFD